MYFHSLNYSTACFLKAVSHNMKVPSPNPALIKSREKIHTDFKKTGSGFVTLQQTVNTISKKKQQIA